MQGIYTHIPETNNVPKQYNVAAILSLLFMVPTSLIIIIIIIIITVKNFIQYAMSLNYLKANPIPLQALTGPQGYSRLRLPDFKTIGT
jgi:hypothetical protein